MRSSSTDVPHCIMHARQYQGSKEVVIETLPGLYPEAVYYERDIDGCTPLYLACDNKASTEIIQLLLDRGPQAVSGKGKSGNTPRHCACLRGLLSLEVLVELLVQGHPDTIQEMNDCGLTPFHLLAQFYPSNTDEVLFLIQMDPEGILP